MAQKNGEDKSASSDAKSLAKDVRDWVESAKGQEAIKDSLDERRESSRLDDRDSISAEVLDKAFTI
jgi:hypothetical protein